MPLLEVALSGSRSKELEIELLEFESLLSWTLSPSQQPEPVTPVCFSAPRFDLETVLDVRHADVEA